MKLVFRIREKQKDQDLARIRSLGLDWLYLDGENIKRGKNLGQYQMKSMNS